MKRSAWVALGLLAMAGGVACGPSKAELASQAKAAAEVRAKAEAKAAEEKAKAEAKAAEEKAKAKAKAAEEKAKAEAAKALSLAEAKAAELRVEADRIDGETAKLREALSLAEAKAEAAQPAIGAAERAHDACLARAQAADERATAAYEARVAQHEAALAGCTRQVEARQANCEDNCSEVEARCKWHNLARPHASEACETAKDACQARCAPSTVCASAQAQLDSTKANGANLNQVDCSATEQRLAAAREPERAAESAKQQVADSESRAVYRRAEADRLIADAKARGDAMVADAKARGDAMVADAKADPRSVVACGVGRVLIPEGTFSMGESGNSATVAAFCMDRTEVTVAAYDACVKAGKCTPAKTGSFYNAGVAGRENHPINGVDWNQATAYCEAQGQHLPTEEEWEYAARGTDGREYPWGNEEPSNQLCWDGEGNDLGKGNRKSTCPVGAYPKGRSPFGLEDMSGNVWEWTSSAYDASNRVFRGGSWYDDSPSDVRSASRRRNVPSLQRNILGFRCAGSSSAVP